MVHAHAVASPPAAILSPANGRPQDPLARAYDMPCTAVLEVPVTAFTVGALMQLRPGSIVCTAAQHNEDIPLHVNGQLIGLAEFDVVGERLAVRLTGVA